MVDRNVSITQSVSKSASITQSVTRAVSIDEALDDSPYAPIVATSPDLLVPLKYTSTSADGQILFQDAACTVPVTTAGDPVGGVLWNGVIVATQSTDANRPTWQGEAIGTQFDGSDDALIVPDSATTDIDGTESATILAWAQTPDISTIRAFVEKNNTAGYYLAIKSGGALRVFWRGATNSDLVEHSVGLDDGADHLFAGVIDRANTLSRAHADTGETTVSQTADDMSSGAHFYIGNAFNSAGVSPWIGTIDVIALHNRALTKSELDDLYNAGRP